MRNTNRGQVDQARTSFHRRRVPAPAQVSLRNHSPPLSTVVTCISFAGIYQDNSVQFKLPDGTVLAAAEATSARSRKLRKGHLSHSSREGDNNKKTEERLPDAAFRSTSMESRPATMITSWSKGGDVAPPGFPSATHDISQL